MIDPTLRQRAHEVLSWLLNSVDPADWPGKAPEIELLGAPMASHAAVTCDSETICYTPHVDDPPGGSEQLAAALADAGPVIRDLLAAVDAETQVIQRCSECGETGATYREYWQADLCDSCERRSMPLG